MRARTASTPSRCRRSTRRCWPCRTEPSAARVVPIENSLEGSVDATLDALAHEARGRRIVDEVVQPVGQPHRADGLDSTTMPHGRFPPAGQRRSARASCASGCPRADVRRGDLDRRGGADGGRGGRAVGGDRPRASPPSSTAASCCAEGIEDHPGNVTRFVWLAPDGDRAAPAAGRAQDVARLLGRRRPRPAGSCACLSEFAFRGVNLTQDRVAAAAQGIGHYMFFVDLEGRADDPRWPRRSPALRTHCARSARARVLSGGA